MVSLLNDLSFFRVETASLGFNSYAGDVDTEGRVVVSRILHRYLRRARTSVRPRPRPPHPPWCGEVTRVEPQSGIRSEQHTPPGTCYSRTTGVNIGSSVKTRPSITFNSVNARNQSRPQSCYGRGLPTHLNHVSEQVI
jgi:hypothetical protein